MSTFDIFKRRKIVVIGSRAAGKSALVGKYITSEFVEEYLPTIEDTYEKIIECNGAEYNCSIIDTPGQDEFSFLHDKYAIGIHGWVLVYSVASRASFEIMKIVHGKIIDFCGFRQLPAVIVGQKVDLLRRDVSTAEATKLAVTLGCDYIETSARDGLNVDRVFELCLAQFERKKSSQRAPPRQDAWCIFA